MQKYMIERTVPGAGDFDAARQTFAEVAAAVAGPADQAEARYNAYRAALEEREYEAALAALTEAARERMRALDYGNVELKTGDGSSGWPDQAPFDAIIVSAGGPRIPQALKSQLAIGGRLVIPIGPMDQQRLVRLTRTGEESFEQDDLGAVRFVKLIGAGGWEEP